MSTDHDADPEHEPLDDPRLQAGLEHLQRAAHEAITASRALLDVAEELIDDPGALRGMLDLVGGLGDQVARRAARVTRLDVDAGSGPRSADEWDGGWDDWDDDGEADDDDPPVQRIPIS